MTLPLPLPLRNRLADLILDALHDDTARRGAGHAVKPHTQDAAYYQETWQTVIDRQACAVVLSTFNEFYEGSYIEPSVQFGRIYLDWTRTLSDRYRGAP